MTLKMIELALNSKIGILDQMSNLLSMLTKPWMKMILMTENDTDDRGCTKKSAQIQILAINEKSTIFVQSM